MAVSLRHSQSGCQLGAAEHLDQTFLNYTGAGPNFNVFNRLRERWRVRVLGSNPAVATDDYFGLLVDGKRPA